MTTDIPPSQSTGTTPSGEEVDFSALVAQQNQSAGSRKQQARRGRSSGEGPPDDGLAPLPSIPQNVPSKRSNRAKSKGSRWWQIGYPIIVGVFLLAVVPALVLVGLRVILDSSDGQLVKRVTDPAAPGYEAVVEKTPTAVAAIVAPDGSLDSAVVFALTSDTSGGMLLVPASLAIATDYGVFPLSEIWKIGAVDSVAAGVGKVLNLNFNEKITIAATDWSTLIGPFAPLNFSIPDAVRDSKDVVVFPKGTVSLKADQVGSFLTSKSAKDNDLNRMIRQELFWKAWLSKVSSSQATFPTPTTSGIGRFVASIARGQLSVSSLPVVPVPAGSPLPGGGPLYTVQENAALDAVAAIVPFPDGAPGARPRLRVLDGTGKLSNGVNAAIMLNAAGGQVDVVGNAKSYGQETTQIIYFEGVTEAQAQKMRSALTLGEIVQSNQSNSGADMTVILGEDFLTKFGPTSGNAATASTTTQKSSTTVSR